MQLLFTCNQYMACQDFRRVVLLHVNDVHVNLSTCPCILDYCMWTVVWLGKPKWTCLRSRKFLQVIFTFISIKSRFDKYHLKLTLCFYVNSISAKKNLILHILKVRTLHNHWWNENSLKIFSYSLHKKSLKCLRRLYDFIMCHTLKTAIVCNLLYLCTSVEMCTSESPQPKL